MAPFVFFKRKLQFKFQYILIKHMTLLKYLVKTESGYLIGSEDTSP